MNYKPALDPFHLVQPAEMVILTCYGACTHDTNCSNSTIDETDLDVNVTAQHHTCPTASLRLVLKTSCHVTLLIVLLELFCCLCVQFINTVCLVDFVHTGYCISTVGKVKYT